MINVLVQVETKPTEHDRFVRAACSLMDATAGTDGNLGYAVWCPANGGSHVLVVERWRDQAAMDAHSASGRMSEFRVAVKGAVAIPPTSERWESADPAAD